MAGVNIESESYTRVFTPKESVRLKNSAEGRIKRAVGRPVPRFLITPFPHGSWRCRFGCVNKHQLL